jgi:hypothetical protein
MLTTSYIVLICSLRIEYIDMGHVDSVFRVRDGIVPDTDCYGDEPTCLLVPGAGIEPALCCQNWILNPARLPVPPPGQCQMNKARKTNKSTHFELEIIWVL